MSTVLGTGEMALLCSSVCARMQNCFIHPVGGYLGSPLCMRVSCITKAGTQLFPSVAQGQLHFVYFVLKCFFVYLFVCFTNCNCNPMCPAPAAGGGTEKLTTPHL